MRYVLVGLMAVLWLVFGVSAWSKVHSRAARGSFAGSLRPLDLLPDRLVAPVARAVTVGEVILTVGLTWAMLATAVALPGERIVVVAALAAAGLLLSVLTSGIGLALGRGAHGRCACFGAAERPLSRRHLARNALLLLTVAGGLAGVATAPTAPARPAAPAGIVLGLATGLAAALVLIRLDDLVTLFGPVRGGGPASQTRN
jgi:hypothetical protein